MYQQVAASGQAGSPERFLAVRWGPETLSAGLSRRNITFIALFSLMVAALLASAGGAFGAGIALAQEQDRGYIDWEMRGFTYSSWWDDEYLSSRSDATLDRISATGANWVSLNVTQYMQYADSSVIAPQTGGNTASDAAIIEAISDARARGMKVMLKPHVDVLNGDVWRGEITPADKAAWFESYRRFINHYAELSEAYGVEILAVGSELASMSGWENYAEWESTVAGVRSRYTGKLTYSASLNEYGYACMWGWMDYLGFNFYFPLSESLDPSVEELMAGWWNYNGRYTPANWLERIRTWQAHWQKPVIFTEIGYRSILGTAISPWDYWTPGAYSGDAQAKAYEAALRVLAGEGYVIGAFWWNWTTGDIYRDPRNTEYSIAGKPAEAVLTDWYTNRVASARPRMSMVLDHVYWNTYEDFTERILSVDFSVTNAGSEPAYEVKVFVGGATNNVTPLSGTVIDLGDIAASGQGLLPLSYEVPQGIASFRVSTYVVCRDGSGSQHFYPVAPPGY